MTDFPCCDPAPSPATPPGGWFYFGSHVDQASWLALEFSDAADEAGDPLWERPIPAPASPAETRGAAWLEELAVEIARGRILVTTNDHEAGYNQGIVYAVDVVRSASPAVSLPGEQPGGDAVLSELPGHIKALRGRVYDKWSEGYNEGVKDAYIVADRAARGFTPSASPVAALPVERAAEEQP